jgi:hypothetical protein
MAFGTTPAGTITKEQTRLSIRRLSVDGGANIAKGNVCSLNPDDFGGLYVATSSTPAGAEWYVALEPADNSSGTDGDISCPVAVKGHYVTVVASGTIHPGMPVKIGSTAGEVIEFVEGTDAEGLKVGIYFGKEGGLISKSTTSPYLESFTDQADFVPVNCADDDVIEILLR